VASIQRIVSPRTQEVTYRVQVRPKGREPESATFPNLKEAKAWAISVEAAIREARHSHMLRPNLQGARSARTEALDSSSSTDGQQRVRCPLREPI
jgi:hypothetical protein